MKVIDGGECAQAVVPESEVCIPSLRCHVKSKQEAFSIDPLRQVLENTRNQEDVSVFNGTNLLMTY